MAGYVRVVTFAVEGDALDALVNEIQSSDGPPPGVPAKGVAVFADREGGKAMVIARFDTEEDLRTGSETLESMSPPGDGMRRLSVEKYEVLLERTI